VASGKKKKQKNVSRARGSSAENSPPRIRARDFIWIAVGMSVLTAFVWGGFRFRDFLLESDMFSVKTVTQNVDDLDMSFSRQNIFLLDIAGIERTILQRHPEYKNAAVSREFPDRMIIDIEKRVPLYQIEYNRAYYQVDPERVIIAGPVQQPYEGIILVQAPFEKVRKVDIGTRVRFEHDSDVMALVDVLNRYGARSGVEITAVHLPDIRNLHFYVNGIDVRIGDREHAGRITTLFERVLPQFNQDFGKIEYIDLRFKDVVIGYRK
jgi:cell division septal protein FtsQ